MMEIKGPSSLRLVFLERKQNHHKATSLSQIDHYGLLGFCFFRRVDFVWLLMSNSELLRIKNGQKTLYKKQKTASSHKKIKKTS
ncbi:hypothetical protein [uncultured Prevotella sp.]|uniref:hypothetical protein n=1 Tax=uncultured Prevotella sp. TaxID=159272 RepID=UPI0026737A21|nr:hypothetical protein [uncultured Prevotella sp.]